jgi:hypothetical protein
MGEEQNILTATVKEQLSIVWNAWKVTIECIPDDQWQAGDIDYLIPARHFAHVLLTTDAFTSELSYEDYDRASMFGGDVWELDPEKLPGKEDALGKLTEFQTDIDQRLDQINDQRMIQPEIRYPFTGKVMLSKMFYMLFHIMHHLGEVGAELKRRGIKGPKW